MSEQPPKLPETNEGAEKYRMILNSIDQGFCIIEMIYDENGTPYDWLFCEVNPAFEKQNGLSNATGKRMLELVPDIEAHWFKIYDDIVRTGKANRFVEGSEAMGRWFDVYAFRYGGEGSAKVAVLFTDITKQKKAEENLKIQTKATLHERKILHDFFMQAPAAFAITKGPDYVFELVNSLYYELTGKEELLGKTVRGAFPELEGQGFFELLDTVYETGESFIGKEMPVMINKKNEGLVELFVTFIYQAYKDIEGKSQGIICFAYDVTEEVRSRKQLEQAYEDLEMKVTFRTIELERLNKEKAEKIAELEKELENLRSNKA